jgi:hypothetical protein
MNPLSASKLACPDLMTEAEQELGHSSAPSRSIRVTRCAGFNKFVVPPHASFLPSHRLRRLSDRH